MLYKLLIVLPLLLEFGWGQSFLSLNQVGYKENLPKYVYTNSNSSSFEIVETNSNQVVYSGNFSSPFSDEHSGTQIKKGDFSDFTTSGNYFIRSNDNLSSFDFQISNNILDNVLRKSLKGFYFQRCGTRLLQTHAGEYQHLACHTVDAFYHSSNQNSVFHLSTGGWHDAGDFGKYVVNGGISVSTLLFAYQLFPNYLNLDDLNIPESGNGIPDILDEVKYELNWFFTMQDTSGGVFHKLTTLDFPSSRLPNEDTETRYLYEISSTATGNFASVMAQASKVYAEFDSEFSNRCLQAAELAWNYLSENPSIVPAGGFTNPDDTFTGQYGDSNDKDERMWSAVNLFLATNEFQYKNYIDQNLTSVGQISDSPSWQDVKTLAYLQYLMQENPTIDLTYFLLQNSLQETLNEYIENSQNSGYQTANTIWDYFWGSNGDIMNRALMLIVGYELLGEDEYFKLALNQLNYILGANGHNISFITGIGENPVLHIHHAQSSADGIDEPIPGLLSGGPNSYLNDPLLQQLFDENTPPAMCFADNEQSYASNEICINWNSPLVFVATYFNGKNSISSSSNPNSNEIPQSFELYQNYPNPFSSKGNSSTKIKFSIPDFSFSSNFVNSNGNITLSVYDTLGRKVATIFNESYKSGYFELNFNPGSLPSGVYFYQLKLNNFKITKKMIMVK